VSTAVSTEAGPGREPDTIAGAARAYHERLKAGDLGSLPVIVVMVFITAFFTFYVPDRVFFTAVNFNNLVVQMAGTTVIATGVVFVLLLGEIDLSVAFLAGIGAVAITYFQNPGQSYTVYGWVAIVIGLALCTAIGAVQGSFVAYVGMPSFVVTLAGNIAFQGVIVRWMGSSAAILVQDTYINDVANYYLSPTGGWLVAASVSVLYGLAILSGAHARRRAGVGAGNVPLLALRWTFATLVAVVVVAISNHATQPTGLPLAGVLTFAVVAAATWVATSTTYGRHIYAVGGNAEAARRAGIDVRFIRLTVFMISGVTAGIGGLMIASQLNAVDLTVGSGPLLLNAIAAAVIGGTSLFGGRGRIVAAPLGAIVITSINNGLGLLGSDPWKQYLITSIILLGAVTLDAVARRRQAAVGR
jgi:D-xylose transport system permease protein